MYHAFLELQNEVDIIIMMGEVEAKEIVLDRYRRKYNLEGVERKGLWRGIFNLIKHSNKFQFISI